MYFSKSNSLSMLPHPSIIYIHIYLHTHTQTFSSSLNPPFFPSSSSPSSSSPSSSSSTASVCVCVCVCVFFPLPIELRLFSFSPSSSSSSSSSSLKSVCVPLLYVSAGGGGVIEILHHRSVDLVSDTHTLLRGKWSLFPGSNGRFYGALLRYASTLASTLVPDECLLIAGGSPQAQILKGLIYSVLI